MKGHMGNTMRATVSAGSPAGPRRGPRRRAGFAYLVAVLGFCLLAAIGYMVCDASILEVRKTQNHIETTGARLAAESGMTYLREVLSEYNSTASLTQAPIISDLEEYLTTQFNDNASLASGWAINLNSDETRLSYSGDPIPLGGDQSFSFSIEESQTETVAGQEYVKQITLHVTGYCNGVSRTVTYAGDVELNKDILRRAISSKIRVILRGRNTRINGDIVSDWTRLEQWSYPFDIGARNNPSDTNEDITINLVQDDGSILPKKGRLVTTMTKEQFNGEESVDGNTLNCMWGIRHDEDVTRAQVIYDAEAALQLSYTDFDTTVYKNRSAIDWDTWKAGGTISDSQKVVLPYHTDSSRHPTLARTADAANFKDDDGNYLYGYKDANKNWIVYGKNPDGKWEFGYTNNAGNWVKVNRDPGEDGPIGQYRLQSGYIRLGDQYVTNPLPDPEVKEKTICDYWANGINFWRAYYQDYDGSDSSRPKFKNLHIPMGSHAHFKNCTFTGITYVESDEETDLSNWGNYTKYNNLRQDAPSGSGSGSSNVRAYNNVVFEDCTFEGPIISAVPKDMRYQENSAMFIGDTKFNASAIQAALGGTTILMPNYNINIGDFCEDAADNESALVGILVGGIVDIRDNANVRGTIVSMANLDHVNWGLSGWGSNVGNWEDSGEASDYLDTTYAPVLPDGVDLNAASETPFNFAEKPDDPFEPSDEINITPIPDNPLPYGVKRRYKIVVNGGIYTESTSP